MNLFSIIKTNTLKGASEMRSCPDPLQQIRVILLDSGCTDQAAEEFLQYWQNGDPAAWRQFLQAHRQQLLENLHADKLRIDRLDYLSDWLERKSGL